MSIKTVIASNIAALWTSKKRLLAERRRAEALRRKRGEPHVIDYFHQIDDPYSHLAAQALLQLQARYEVRIRVHLVPPPADWAAPERALLQAYARLDAARLSEKSALPYVDPGFQPVFSRAEAAAAELAGHLEAQDILTRLIDAGTRFWSGETMAGPAPQGAAKAGAAWAAGEAERTALGHFLGAVMHYGGEWYWGIDRLHYLEDRLTELGCRRPGGPAHPIYAEPHVPAGHGAPKGERPVLHYYLSFRSPYTYIAAERAKALADAYGAELRLRYVLPMIMRGLPVPQAKRRYFTLDSAREARRAGVPFGRIADPVGRPVERGYAIFPYAIEEGRGFDYALAFMRAVWSQGVDAGSDDGLKRIVEAAGLNWRRARSLIGDDSWRPIAEANRQEMMALGLWGVPSFRVGETSAWGQDRLWVIEDALVSATNPG